MASFSDTFKQCGVIIEATISGIAGKKGSGVLYTTPSYCKHNYILSTKHTLQEEVDVPYSPTLIGEIKISYYNGDIYDTLVIYRKQKDISENVIAFEEDFSIILVPKREEINAPKFIVTDDLQKKDLNFFCWGTFGANDKELHLFAFERNDAQIKRYKLSDQIKQEYAYGMSGAGLIKKDRPELVGLVCLMPNEYFQNSTIDCVPKSFEKVNEVLIEKDLPPLATKFSPVRKQVGDVLVDMHQAFINNTSLDLEVARRRLKTDIRDDWYHDPLQFVDLLRQDYLSEQLAGFFNKNRYRIQDGEACFIPKENLTLRRGQISPFIDRIIYMACVGVIAEKMDDALLPLVFSARYDHWDKNRLVLPGVEQWKKMSYYLNQLANEKTGGDFDYDYVVEIDLLNFFDNIDLPLLREKIQRVCKTKNEINASNLLMKILEGISRSKKGLPQNSDASSLLASFYLNQVDAFMDNHCHGYVRFMDDIRIFCKTKYDARRLLQLIEFELRRCSLSVNSQKTKILKLARGASPILNEVERVTYGDSFDPDIQSLNRLKSSSNFVYRNEAFHICKNLIKEIVIKEIVSKEDRRRLSHTLNTLAFLGRKGVLIYDDELLHGLSRVAESLYEKPWMTKWLCSILNVLPTDIFQERFAKISTDLVLNENYNIYSYQNYQLWLLLAKHQIAHFSLKKYAVEALEKNDETNRAGVAAMIIYICSVDINYRRIILRKLDEGAFRGILQNRAAMIAIRSFFPETIPLKKIPKFFSAAPSFTHQFAEKDLVFVEGMEEADLEEGEEFEQLYSI